MVFVQRNDELSGKSGRKSGRPSYQVYNKELIKELALSPEKIKGWSGKNGNYKAFQFHGFKKELNRIVQEAGMQGLSKTDPARKPLSREESRQQRLQRNKDEENKNKFFKPIQKEIISEHGEHAATLILGNRVISMIFAGEADQLKPYQLKLIKEQGRKLGTDLSPFFQS